MPRYPLSAQARRVRLARSTFPITIAPRIRQNVKVAISGSQKSPIALWILPIKWQIWSNESGCLYTLPWELFMDTWDIVILVVVAYVAITTLVRLMIRRRNILLARFRRQMAEEKKSRKKQANADQTGRAA